MADTGRGMSPGTRKHVYDAFFTTKGAAGTGLGLWLAAGILAKHGASMHLRGKRSFSHYWVARGFPMTTWRLSSHMGLRCAMLAREE